MRPRLRTAVLLAGGLAGACSSPTSRPSQAGPRQVIEGLELSQSTRGRRDWRLTASLAVLREDDREAVLTEPRMEFHSEGRLVSRAEARSGLVLTGSQDVVLSTRVVVRSLSDGSVLETELLRYDSKDRRLRTDRPVSARRPGGRLRGRGLEAAPDLSEIRIFGQESVIEGAPR